MGADLITGASGFIGRHLKGTLLEGGRDVVAICRPSSPEPEAGRSVRVDYADVDALTEVMKTERPERIFHVAGATKGVTYDDFRRANVMPTENLVAALARAEHTPRRFVLVSSLAAYGPSSEERPKQESDEPTPIEHYGKSKLEAEQVLAAANIPYTILRPGGVYGPGDVDYFELFKQAEKGWSVFFGNRDRWFSGVYVDDLVEATLVAADHDKAVDRGYFICDGVPITWQSFQRTISEVSGKKVRELDLPEALVSIAAWGGELLSSIDKKPRLFNRQKALMGKQIAWTCTHKRAREDFGYVPKVDVEAGARLALDWYRDNGWV
ncbi:MAG: NAD-dependent epimerase/dehydratase family protein [Deltaproteobacteria bacterium]